MKVKYRTLCNEVIDLASLSKIHREIYEKVKQAAEQDQEWTSFSNFWIEKARELNIPTESAIFKIFQDMDSRVGIRQKLTRLPNWREELDRFIESRFKSRYEFCKIVGLDQGHLSSILNGKKNISIANLTRIFDKVGFRMIFVGTNISSTGEE